jgi:aspartate 1-decarboxylase
MKREFLKSKIHRATVTDAHLNYEGSITIDPVLMELAGLREFEKVHVVDINNGARFETYCILGTPESGDICLNGAAARLVHVGDLVIIMAYGWFDESEIPENGQFSPKIIRVDEKNQPLDSTPPPSIL